MMIYDNPFAWFGVSNFNVLPLEESGKVFHGQPHIFDSFLSVGSEIGHLSFLHK